MPPKDAEGIIDSEKPGCALSVQKHWLNTTSMLFLIKKEDAIHRNINKVTQSFM